MKITSCSASSAIYSSRSQSSSTTVLTYKTRLPMKKKIRCFAAKTELPWSEAADTFPNNYA